MFGISPEKRARASAQRTCLKACCDLGTVTWPNAERDERKSGSRPPSRSMAVNEKSEAR